jgi:outer membrane protein OmpA-like peptidoglycan-associated protein
LSSYFRLEKIRILTKTIKGGQGMKRNHLVTLIAAIVITAAPLCAQHDEGQVTLGMYGSATKLAGDDKDWDMISPWFGLKIGYTVVPRLTLALNGGYGWTAPRDIHKSGFMKYLKKLPDTPFKTTLIPVIADVQLNFRPEHSFNPYIHWGYGLLIWDLKSDGSSVYNPITDALADWGIGFEFFIVQALALDLSVHYQHIMNQNEDMSGYDDVQSGIAEARAGISLFFGGNKDKDEDGILNKDDKCPNEPEDIDGFQDSDGCPDPDNDGDGILDLKDQAPNQAEDIDGFEDEDGIPDLDNDGDGIPDLTDQAPNQAEDIDGFMDEDGIPDPDNDNDGILDTVDQCPDAPETVNGFQDEDGCPDKKPEIIIEKEAPIILEGVTFETGSASLTPEAKAVLDKVIQTLVDYPEMVLEVNGYTDSSGSRSSNIRLSQQRADAVKAFFVSKGIDTDRIIAKGYGPDKPVAPNETPEGRAKNRRIEFNRIK